MRYTPQELVDNIHDSEWRMNNLYYIKDKYAQTIPFKMNATQKVLHDSEAKYNMTLKGRQQGVSTYYLIKYLDQCMWNENQTVGIISHDRGSIEKLFRIPHFVYKNLPEHIRPRLDRGMGSAYMLYFPHLNSRIYVALEVRSESITALHISEYGLMKDKTRFNASIEAVPVDYGHISIESTPFGMNHFYDDWVDPTFPYEKHFFPWFYHYENKIAADYDLKYTKEEKVFIERVKKEYSIELGPDQINWRRFKIKQKGLSKFLEEHPEDDINCFLMSGRPVMDLPFIKKLLKEAPKPIRKIDDVKMFKEPNRNMEYVIGVDTAEGVGLDYSVACIIEKETMVQVAQFRGQLSPFDFAHKLNMIGTMYKTNKGLPLLGVERNNHGHAVLLELEQHIKYGNIYKHKDGKVGWVTDRVTRPIMIDTFLQAVQNQTYTINDEDTLGECLTLIDKRGKIEAVEGKHDDTIIASSIGLQMTTQKTAQFVPRISAL